MPDKVKAQMLLIGDILSPDGEIRIVGKKTEGDIITLEVKIGMEDQVTHFGYDQKVPIYNYD